MKRLSFLSTLFQRFYRFSPEAGEPTSETYPRPMAAYSISGRVSSGSRHGATWPPFNWSIPRVCHHHATSGGRRWVTVRGRGTGNVTSNSVCHPVPRTNREFLFRPIFLEPGSVCPLSTVMSNLSLIRFNCECSMSVAWLTCFYLCLLKFPEISRGNAPLFHEDRDAGLFLDFS